MTAEPNPNRPPEVEGRPPFDAHRLAMIELARKVNEAAGISEPPLMTVEELQASLIAKGIRPEDNLLSSEIIRLRYEDEGAIMNHQLSLLHIIEAADARLGIPLRADVNTAQLVQEARASQIARGIRPEDNEASRELIALRDDGFSEEQR